MQVQKIGVDIKIYKGYIIEVVYYSEDKYEIRKRFKESMSIFRW